MGTDFTKQALWLAHKHMQRCSTSIGHLGNSSANTMKYWYTTPLQVPLEWLTQKCLIIPSISEHMEQLNLSYTADGNVKLHNHFGDSLAVS